MLEWEHAAPLIGVIATAFVGLAGVVFANRVRSSPDSRTVPAAIAGAVAERGVAEGLTLALTALTAVVSRYVDAADRARDEDEDRRRKRHLEMIDELRRLSDSIRGR